MPAAPVTISEARSRTSRPRPRRRRPTRGRRDDGRSAERWPGRCRCPSKSSAGCNRWKTPKSLSAYCMSNPTPLSRTNTVGVAVAGVDAADLDRGLRARARELDGVGHQVHEREAQHGAVGVNLGKGTDGPGDVAPLGLRAHLFQDLLDERVQAHRRRARLGPADSREGQQIVDESAHALGRFQDQRHVPPALVVEPPGGALLEQLGIAGHVPEGRPQVVGDRIGERLQLLVGGLEARRCAGPDAG